jgi:hypothetical protein
MGKVIDIMGRLTRRAEPTAHDPVLAPPAPTDAAQASASADRLLGERADGTIDLAAWRARWRQIYAKEFALDLGRGRTAPEGSLRFYHDPRSNSLEFFAMDHEGATARHVLSPTDAMALILALNSAYGFDPQGPNGSRMSDMDDRSPWSNGPSVA